MMEKTKNTKTESILLVIAITLIVLAIELIQWEKPTSPETKIYEITMTESEYSRNPHLVRLLECEYAEPMTIKCADGSTYSLNPDLQAWYNEDGSIRYHDGDILTAVIMDQEPVALFNEGTK